MILEKVPRVPAPELFLYAYGLSNPTSKIPIISYISPPFTTDFLVKYVCGLEAAGTYPVPIILNNINIVYRFFLLYNADYRQRWRVALRKNLFNIFKDKVLDFPLWVKQVLYIKLRDEMKSHLCKAYTDAEEDNLLSVHVPILTFKGKTELEDRKDGLDENIYGFLNLCSQGLSMLEISLSTFLSMEEAAKYFIFCIEQEYIKKPLSSDINAMAGFIAGKYRIGEYFRLCGTITEQQLEAAITEQKSVREKGHNIKFADVMIAMGMINEADVHSILVLKEEAKKRFVLDYTMVPKGECKYADADEELIKENSRLKEENEILKRKMSQLVGIVKKNGNH